MPTLYKTANIKNNNNNKYIWHVQVTSPSELTADLFCLLPPVVRIANIHGIFEGKRNEISCKAKQVIFVPWKQTATHNTWNVKSSVIVACSTE